MGDPPLGPQGFRAEGLGLGRVVTYLDRLVQHELLDADDLRVCISGPLLRRLLHDLRRELRIEGCGLLV
jgi:hypothetical protein